MRRYEDDGGEVWREKTLKEAVRGFFATGLSTADDEIYYD